MKKTIFTLPFIIILAAFVLSACSGIAAAQAPTTPEPQLLTPSTLRTISVSGTGKAILTPDIAYVYLGVHSESSNAKQAVSDNNSEASKVMAALKSFGIADKDIKTSNFSISPQQQYDKDGKLTGVLYVVDNTIYVTVRDLSKIGDLLDTVVQAGVNNVFSIQFDVADLTAALSQARKSAVVDANSQASDLAQAAGVSLGDVQSITTSSNPTPPIMYDLSSRGAAQAAAPSVPVSPGEMTITVDVSVVYNIK